MPRRCVGQGVDVGDHRDLRVAEGGLVRRALRSRLRAGAMNGVWKAPPTATGATLRAPSSQGEGGGGADLGRAPAMTRSSGAL